MGGIESRPGMRPFVERGADVGYMNDGTAAEEGGDFMEAPEHEHAPLPSVIGDVVEGDGSACIGADDGETDREEVSELSVVVEEIVDIEASLAWRSFVNGRLGKDSTAGVMDLRKSVYADGGTMGVLMPSSSLMRPKSGKAESGVLAERAESSDGKVDGNVDVRGVLS